MIKIAGRWSHQDTIKIEWNLGKRCNYDCSYCPTSIHDNSSKHTDIAILKQCVDTLSTLGKPVRLSFTGGEPTVHPKFGELLIYCRERGISWISVTTNGTRKSVWYLAQSVDQWVFSLHFETPDWRRVIDAVIQVHSKWVGGMVVNVMAHHDRMIAVRAASTALLLAKVPMGIRRIRWTEGDHDVFDDNRYTDEDITWINSNYSTVLPNVIIDDTTQLHANDVIKLHLNQYNGWQCNAGLESLMINWDGEVHRATCRVGGSLGNIYNGSFKRPTTAVTCTRNWCTCAADIPLTKVAY